MAVASYPKLLPKPKGNNPRLGVRPPRRAWWLREVVTDALFLADGSNAIAEADVEKDDIEHLFPGHAAMFGEPLVSVLKAASSGYMNDEEAMPSEQTAALRALLACPDGTCEWAQEAIDYLLAAGCYGDDGVTLPCVTEALKKKDYNKAVVGALLPRTDLDKVRRRPCRHVA